jgi:hypothetical protein
MRLIETTLDVRTCRRPLLFSLHSHYFSSDKRVLSYLILFVVEEWKAKASHVTEQGKELYQAYVQRCQQLQRLSTQVQQLHKETQCKDAQILTLRQQLEHYTSHPTSSLLQVSTSIQQQQQQQQQQQLETHDVEDNDKEQNDYKRHYTIAIQDKRALEHHITSTHHLFRRNVSLAVNTHKLHQHVTSIVELLQMKNTRLDQIHTRLLNSTQRYITHLRRLATQLTQLDTTCRGMCTTLFFISFFLLSKE